MNSSKKFLFTAAILSAALITAPRFAHAQTIINLPSNGGGFSYAGDVGESITVPASPDISLDSFQFYALGAGGSIKFQAQVYQFDTSTGKTVGSALYTSTLQTATTHQTFVFTPTGLSLTPGGTYLLDLHQEGFGNSGNLQLDPSSNTYAGGQLLEFSNSLDSWSHAGAPYQSLAFEAIFNAPEPTSLFLLSVGGSLLLRRRTRSA